MSKSSQEHLPARLWWVLAGLTLVWGFNWTAMKVAISDIAPFTFRTLCLGLGSGVLFAFLRAGGQPLAIPRDQWKRLVLIAFFSITLWNLLVVFGLALLPSGRAAILAYTMPAWSIPLSVLFLGERLTGRKLLGLALGMAGMALLVWDEFHRIQGAPRGALLVLGAAFTWAIGTILQKKYPVRAPLAAFTAWLMLLGGVPIYLGALLLEDFTKLATGSSNRIAAAILLDDPPSIDAQEITDKGSLNQRAILENRRAVVDELYGGSARAIFVQEN